MSGPLWRALCAAASFALFPIAAAQASPSEAGAPHAFTSVPLPVGHMPFDAAWRRVLAAPPPSSSASESGQLSGLAKLRFVNAWANKRVAYKKDRGNWGADDYWATAGETLAKGAGDCEDLAILKMQLLRAAGVPASRIYLVVGHGRIARRAHATLLVRESGKLWVLDGSTDSIHNSDEYTDFRPVMSFGAHGQWLHGYKAGTAPAGDYGDAVTREHGIIPAAVGPALAATIAEQDGASRSRGTRRLLPR